MPSSITALPQAFLQQSGASQVEDVVRAVPGLAYTQNSAGQAVLAIRGIQTSAAFSNFQAPVAIYYDEVPVLDPLVPWNVPQLQLFDISRVEVLRGPQGTLYGAGSLSGTLRLITNNPNLTRYDAATEDTVSSTEGGGVGYAFNGMVNLPLVPGKLAARVVGYDDYSAGWIDNPTLGEKNGNHAAVYGGRAELAWQPIDNLNFTATVANEVTRPHDSNYLPYGSQSYVADNRVPIYDNDNTTIYNLVSNYEMPFATLTSSTSYVYRDAFSSLDFSGTSHLVTGLNTVSPLLDAFNTGNFMQEFRLASTQEHRFKWLVGAFIQNYRFALCELITQPGLAAIGGNSQNTLEHSCGQSKIVDQAGFGEVSYDILPQLTLTAGARYAHYSVDSAGEHGLNGPDLFGGAPGNSYRAASYEAVTPKFSISYRPTQDVMVYVLADEGYRNGEVTTNTLKDPITGQALPSYYQPDQLWNYEIGTKAAFLDHRVTVDADIYYIDWTKIILGQTTGSGINFIGNAGNAHAKGVEFQLTTKPVDHWEFGTSLAYNDAKMVSVGPGVSATVGDRLPGSAPFTAYAYGQYDMPVFDKDDLSLRLDYSYTGREYAYLQNFHNPTALHYGDYSAVGAQASLHFGRYELMLVVRNLTDGKGRTGARTLYKEPVEVLQTPRTVGLTFRAHM